MSIENIEMDIETEMKQSGMPKDAKARVNKLKAIVAIERKTDDLTREYADFARAYLDRNYFRTA